MSFKRKVSKTDPSPSKRQKIAANSERKTIYVTDISDYIEVDEPKEESIPKVSLNPLPPERLMPRTSEEREKSSEPGQDEVIDMPGHSVPLSALGGMVLVFGFLAQSAGKKGTISQPGDGEAIARTGGER